MWPIKQYVDAGNLSLAYLAECLEVFNVLITGPLSVHTMPLQLKGFLELR